MTLQRYFYVKQDTPWPFRSIFVGGIPRVKDKNPRIVEVKIPNRSKWVQTLVHLLHYISD